MESYFFQPHFVPYAFLVASCFFWSFFDISRKQISALLGPTQTLFYLLIFQIPIFLTSSIFFETFYWSNDYIFWGLLGVAVNFIANIFFVYSVHISELSRSIPLLSLTPVFSALLSYLMLGEHMNAVQILGIGIVVLSAFALSGTPSFRGDAKGPTLMLIASMGWAAMIVIDKVCIQHANISLHVSFQCTGMLGLVWLFARYQKINLKINFKKKLTLALVWGALVAFLAVVFQLIALENIAVGKLESFKRAFTMSLALLWGAMFFKEKITFKKVFCVALMSVGVYLLLM